MLSYEVFLCIIFAFFLFLQIVQYNKYSISADYTHTHHALQLQSCSTYKEVDVSVQPARVLCPEGGRLVLCQHRTGSGLQHQIRCCVCRRSLQLKGSGAEAQQLQASLRAQHALAQHLVGQADGLILALSRILSAAAVT